MGLFEIFSGMLAGFYAVIPSYGLAIILLTVAVRVLLLPLSIKQTRSMREMQRIQPEIKKLQTKYKGDRQKLNEEMMALYKEHKVNPFGGCLPLLMQLPVFIGLFYVIRTPLKYMGFAEDGAKFVPRADVSGFLETLQDSSLAQGLFENALKLNSFLGIRLDCSSSAALSDSDPSNLGVSCGDGIVSALPYLILVALMGITTWIQQRQMQGQRGATDAQAQQMQLFMKIMPVMLMFFAFSFPTGVVLYWITTNAWTILQQRIMFHAAPPLPAMEPSKTAKTAKAPGAGSKPELAKTNKKPASNAAKESAAAEGDGVGTRSPHASKKKRRR